MKKKLLWVMAAILTISGPMNVLTSAFNIFYFDYTSTQEKSAATNN